MLSGSGLADAVMGQLTSVSGSVFDATPMTGNLTKNDFGLLDTTTSGCVFIVLPGGFQHQPIGFGNPGTHESRNTLMVKAFIRDTGNSVGTLNAMWQSDDELGKALDADNTLSGSVMEAHLARGNGWDGMTFAQSGDVVWIPQDLWIEIYDAD